MKKLLMAGMLCVGMLSGIQAAHAQSASPEVQALEEQVRQLNGRIEEMSFQLLQMQEQLRKAQEDNEFRFQELEKGGSQKSGALEKPAGADSAGTDTADAATDPATAGSAGDDVAKIIEQPAGEGALPGVGQLGSIEMDASGNPVKATIDPGAANGGNATGSQVASTGGSEADSYQIAYSHVLSGDYGLAEQEFQSYITRYPQGKKVADANFWLGEAYYSQGKFNEAAKTFLKAHQTYGKSPKAPEMLLKLGMSLAALDNNETACATYREVTKRYPKASRTVINKVASEQKRLGC